SSVHQFDQLIVHIGRTENGLRLIDSYNIILTPRKISEHCDGQLVSFFNLTESFSSRIDMLLEFLREESFAIQTCVKHGMVANDFASEFTGYPNGGDLSCQFIKEHIMRPEDVCIPIGHIHSLLSQAREIGKECAIKPQNLV